jgi:hypothetical protein
MKNCHDDVSFRGRLLETVGPTKIVTPLLCAQAMLRSVNLPRSEQDRGASQSPETD